MKRIGVIAALAVAGVAFWYLQRSPAPSAAASDAVPGTSPSTYGTGSQPATAGKAVDKVTKLATADERRRLADRIAHAQATRGATSARPVPRLPDAPADEPAVNKTAIRSAMREMIPHLTECYEAARPTLPSPDFKMTAELTLTGDPDIGTIIDAKALADHAGAPLPAKLDDCLRSTFQLMALPPLAEGDKVEVRYPFEFRGQ